jgi:glutathione-regulated potassium-efflux system ancillary protein KefC
MSARSVLETMGWQPHSARNQALRFRRHSIELMERMAPHFNDEKQLIAISKQGRQQLEEMWAAERRDADPQRQAARWHAPHALDGAVTEGAEPAARDGQTGGPG